MPAGRSDGASRALQCPYCKEFFEGRVDCPEHELILVPREPEPNGIHSDEQSWFLDPRMGRGGVLAGAMLACIGFFMPLVEARSAVASGIELASEGATNLWLTPIAALSLLWILWLRRRPNQMRAARLAILGLCVGGVLPLLYTTRRVALMADFASADAHWLAGLWTMAGGLVLSGVSSFWLGLEPEPARPSC